MTASAKTATGLSPVTVGASFAQEFPGCDPEAAQAAANVMRLAADFLAEIDRRRRRIARLSASGFQALAVLDGAAEPLSSTEVADHLLVTTASMTSLVDTLVSRGWVERVADSNDRRRVRLAITEAGRVLVDAMLPVVHAADTELFGVLTAPELRDLVAMCTRVRARIAEVRQAPPRAAGRRVTARGTARSAPED